MSYHDQIRQKARQLGIDVTTQQVSRVAGTLQFAGARRAHHLEPLITKALQQLANEVKRELPVVTARDATDATFQKIDASLQQGMCPRCGKKMRDVKLADNTPAIYCDSECRITLWPPEKESK